jgi:aryl-alcohol dehydrogenase-like predicted oxidoreductase
MAVLEKRRLGRIGHMTSVVMYGGAALGEVSQEEADRSVQHALDHGVNHFDTAASYGDSELRLGPWMERLRGEVFLATKTERRDRAGAAEQIRRSLERLRVERVDLLQLHAIGDMRELDLVTRTGGALEAAVAAQEEGLVGAIGITGHGHQAPATHLEALRRYPFATVLTPLNPVLYANARYREDFEALVAEAARQDAAVRVIKAVARGPWPDGQARNYATWYEPLESQAEIDRAVWFALSHPGVVAIAGPGDIHLLPRVIDAAERFRPLGPEEREEAMALAAAAAHTSPFGAF